MIAAAPLTRALGQGARAPLRWAAGWGRIIHLTAVLLVLALSRRSYDVPTRLAVARHVYLDTAPILAGFSLLCALLTLVITRIVVVTSQSYGLSQYALEMVVRVLVLELIPLTAALFVALRCTIPNGAALAAMRRDGRWDAMRQAGQDPMRSEALPRLVAGIFSTVTLAALSGVLAIFVAYFTVYGFTVAGLPAFTRMFGHLFNGPVSLIFALKTLFFSLAVSAIPNASALYDAGGDSARESLALRGLVRMFAVLLVLEAVSLVGNYYR